MSRHRTLAFVLPAAMLVVALARPAAGEQATTAQAQAHFQRATEHYAAGRYQEALDEYRLAHELVPHPSSLFNMARCHENLGDFPQALVRYREALEGTTDGTERADIQGRIDRIMQRPIRVFVTSEPSGATVLVDARETPETQTTPATVELTPGPHRLIHTAEGFQPTSHRVVVEVGQEQPISVSLTPLPATPEAPGCPEQEECPSCRRTSYEGNVFHLSIGLPTFFPLAGAHASVNQTGIGLNIDALVSIGRVVFGGSINMFPLDDDDKTREVPYQDGSGTETVAGTQSHILFDVSLQAGYAWAWDVIAITLMGGIEALIDVSTWNMGNQTPTSELEYTTSLDFSNSQLLGVVATSFEFFIRRWLSFSLDVRLAMGGTFRDPSFQAHAFVGMSLDFHI